MPDRKGEQQSLDNLIGELGLKSLSEGRLFDSMSRLSKVDLIRIFNAHAVEALRDLSVVAADWIGTSSKNLMRRIERISISEDLEINGKVWPAAKDKSFNIEVNVGLGMFCYRLASVFVAYTGTIDDDGQPCGNSMISLEEAAQKTNDLVASYSRDQISYLLVPLPTLIRELGEYESALGASVIEFVVGHELGHVIAQTSQMGTEVQQAAEEMLKERLQSIQRLGNPVGLATEWAKELAADFISLRIVMQRHSLVGYASMELFFLVCDLLEDLAKTDTAWDLVLAFERTGADWDAFAEFARKNNHFLGAHPLSAVRVGFLRLITHHLPPIRSWSTKAQSLRDAVCQLRK